MSTHDASTSAGGLQLNDEDVAYLMNVLRNATQPVMTQQLIDILRRQPSQTQGTSEGAGEGG